MSKLYFPNVYRYNVYENLLLISWLNSFECVDFITGNSVFKLDHKLWYFTVINDKIFAQKDEGVDILVCDLTGKLIKTFSGRFILWKNKLDGQFLFLPGYDEKNEKLGFKIDILTLAIVEKIENYGNPRFVKSNLGFSTLANEIYCYNLFTGYKIWTYDLGEGITPEYDWCYLNNDHLIITAEDERLICLHTETGECLWQKKPNLYNYTMHPVNKNLYGFGGTLMEIIDSKTAELIFSKEFPEIKTQFNGKFGSNRSEVQKDGLYFAQLSGDKKFGKINIPGHELDFVMDIDIPQGTDLLKPSFPHRNCYFAFDYNYNLHVYRHLKS